MSAVSAHAACIFHMTSYPLENHAYIAVHRPADSSSSRMPNRFRPHRATSRSASPSRDCAAPTFTSSTATWTRASRTPLVFGHEMSGVITAVGPRRRRSGASATRVTVMPLSWDGACPACRAGQRAHLPEPRLHRHRLPRRTAGEVERSRVDARAPAGIACRSTSRRSWSPSRWRCTTCAGRSSSRATGSSSSAAAPSACSSPASRATPAPRSW